MHIRPSRTFSDPHWSLAGVLLQENGVEPEDRVLLRENLASYLSHLVTPGRAQRLTRAESATLELLGQGERSRWVDKMARDLAEPYTDQEVFGHLRDLEAGLKSALGQVMQGVMQPYPARVYLQGSLMRGRLGANSDLDVMVESSNPTVLQRVESAFLAQRQDGVVMHPASGERPGFNKFMRMLSGPSCEVPLDAPTGWLTDLYEARLEQRGLKVSEDGGEIEVERVGPAPDRQEVSRVFQWAADSVWGEDLTPEQKLATVHKPSLKSLVLHSVGGAVGALSETGVLGPPIRAAVGLMVRQD
ncbi:MAG: nucleotidyltransferase domain-containing protein [Candidatus Eremiobacterota bacterium]